MNYEQKYKQALEKVEGLLKDQEMALHAREKLANVFPELAESEDERIKQGLIEYFRSQEILYDKVIGSITTKEVLSWLEKQGEQKQTWKPNEAQLIVIKSLIEDKSTSKVNKVILRGMLREIDDAYLQGICDAKHEIEKLGESTRTNIEIPFGANDSELQEVSYYIPEGFYAEIKDDRVVIKKVEPKFKVGDWVVSNNDGEVWQIGARYTEEGQRIYLYNVNDVMMSITLDELNNDYHLWTIADAKDGDVLVTENFIFIFKNIDNSNCVHYYCHYEIDKHEDDKQFGVALPQSLMGHADVSHYALATKEQRDTLMKAMAGAGWTFDFKKKELKKKAGRKFKVKDWVILNGTVAQILDKQKYGFVGLDIDGKDFFCNYGHTDSMRLWSINDAKDGDLIYVGTEVKGIQAIFHKFENGIIYFHCNLCSDFTQGGYEPSGDVEFVSPLQKTHYQRFFQKMKEAGYEWSADKKELKKIDIKSIDCDKVIG